MSKPDDFDWSADNPDLVTERQPAIAVYENAGGSISIRQEADWNEDQDPVIIVTKANVTDLVQALLRVAGVSCRGSSRLLSPPPAPTAAPEKQKRDAVRKGGDAAHNCSASLFADA